MQQWRWTLIEEWKNGVTKTEQHSGQQPFLRDAMDDVAKTVEYMLECRNKGELNAAVVASALHAECRGFDPLLGHLLFFNMQTIPDFYYIPTGINREVADLIKSSVLETSRTFLCIGWCCRWCFKDRP